MTKTLKHTIAVAAFCFAPAAAADCPKGEHATQGECCPVGLEFENGACVAATTGLVALGATERELIVMPIVTFDDVASRVSVTVNGKQPATQDPTTGLWRFVIPRDTLVARVAVSADGYETVTSNELVQKDERAPIVIRAPLHHHLPRRTVKVLMNRQLARVYLRDEGNQTLGAGCELQSWAVCTFEIGTAIERVRVHVVGETSFDTALIATYKDEGRNEIESVEIDLRDVRPFPHRGGRNALIVSSAVSGGAGIGFMIGGLLSEGDQKTSDAMFGVAIAFTGVAIGLAALIPLTAPTATIIPRVRYHHADGSLVVPPDEPPVDAHLASTKRIPHAPMVGLAAGGFSLRW